MKYLILLISSLILCQNNFDSDKAFSYLELQCDFGPRFPGSQGHLDFKNYLTNYYLFN